MKKLTILFILLLIGIGTYAQQNEVYAGGTYGFRDNDSSPGLLIGYERIFDKFNIGAELAFYHVEVDRSNPAAGDDVNQTEWINREVGIRFEYKPIEDNGFYIFAKPSVSFNTREFTRRGDIQNLEIETDFDVFGGTGGVGYQHYFTDQWSISGNVGYTHVDDSFVSTQLSVGYRF